MAEKKSVFENQNFIGRSLIITAIFPLLTFLLLLTEGSWLKAGISFIITFMVVLIGFSKEYRK
jgi:VIT1/CCC1 family predicted Fe2+/Mn2+ transporter